MKSVEIIQGMVSQIHAGKQSRSILIVLAPTVDLEPELEKQFVIVEHEMPDREQLKEIAEGIGTGEGELPQGKPLEQVLDAAGGLTRGEAESAFSLSLVRHGRIQPDAIWELKSQMLKKSGLLEMYHGDADFDSLGGLSRIEIVLQTGVEPVAKGKHLLGMPTLALAEVRKDSSWRWVPGAVNNNHAAFALVIDESIYVFDPWMASYRDSARAKSYGEFGSGHEWNGKEFKDWAGDMYDLDYRLFTLSTFHDIGLRKWKHERITEVMELYLDDLEPVPDVTGSWQGFYNDGKETVRFAVTFNQKEKRLSGNITFHLAGKTEKGTVTGLVDESRKVRFTWRRPPQNIISKTFSGSLKKSGKSISGRLTTSNARTGEFRIVR